MKNIKRIFAIIALVLIAAWIVTTIVLGIIGSEWFPKFMIGSIILPIVAWVFIWMVGILTNKKTIASFRSEEMDETMKQAEEIRIKLAKEAAGEESSEAGGEETE